MSRNSAKTPTLPRDERRSIIQNRALLARLFHYAGPHRRAILTALVFSLMSGFLGSASLLPLIPIINMILSTPEEGVVVVEEPAPAPMPQSAALDTAGDAASGLAERFPIVGRFLEWADSTKDSVRDLVQDFVAREGPGAIKWIVLFLLIMVIAKALCDYVAKVSMGKVVYRSVQRLKVDLYSSCLNLDLAYLQSRTSGSLLTRLSSDTMMIHNTLKQSMTQIIQQPFQIVFLMVLLFILSPTITLVTLGLLPLLVVPMALFARRLRSLSRLDAEEDAYLVDVMNETLQGMSIVKAFGTEQVEYERFQHVSGQQLRRQIRRLKFALAGPAISEIMAMVAIAGVIVAGTYIVLVNRQMSSGEFVVYLLALQRFYKPLKEMSNGIVRVQRGVASADRIFEIMDTEPIVKEKPDAIDLPRIHKSILFDNVSFTYGHQRDFALRDLVLEIPKGQRVALVGASGSGKTTVARLIPRFYDPTSGAVRIDGVDLREVTLASLRSQISIVTQETILFAGSVYDNIAYGRREATREEVEAAARAANAHDFIKDLPNGYQTSIGERGGQLSGGQRQRIAIARAILRDCPILILDEATSALDNESEKLVQEALDRLMHGRTSLIIAHRLSTVRAADSIAVLSDGHVVEQGTHDELLDKGGRYADLCQRELLAPHSTETGVEWDRDAPVPRLGDTDEDTGEF